MSYDRDDGDYMSEVLLRRETRTARSVHKCECGKPIKAGERYTYQFAILDGSPSHSKVSDEHLHSYETDTD